MTSSFLSGVGTGGVAISAGLTQVAAGTSNAIEGVGLALGCVLEGIFGAAGVGLRTMLLSLAQGIEILSGRDGVLAATAVNNRLGGGVLAEHDSNDDGLSQHQQQEQQQPVHFTELLSLPAPSRPSCDGRVHEEAALGIQSTEAPSSTLIVEQCCPTAHSDVDTTVIDAALSVLVISSPAAEKQCLSALSLAMHHPTTKALMQIAADYLSISLPATNPALVAAAAAATPSAILTPSATLPYPCPTTADSATDSISNVLLNSYAASWLSMLNVSKADNNSAQDRLGFHEPLPSSHLTSTFWDDGSEGSSCSASRLPLPGPWPLMESHLLPNQRQLPVGLALLLNLGLHLSPSTYYSSAAPNPASRLKWAVHLSYLFDSRQLLAGMEEGGGPVEDTTMTATEALGQTWCNPLVRWSLAGLVQQLCVDSCTQEVRT
jgi:hypothetical protein